MKKLLTKCQTKNGGTKLDEAAQLCEKAGIKVDIEREMNKPENEEEEI